MGGLVTVLFLTCVVWRELTPCLRADCLRVCVLCVLCVNVRVATALDGAYFGRTFPHLFLMVYPQEVPTMPVEVFLPRIYGFRVADRSMLRAPATSTPSSSSSTSARGAQKRPAAATGAAGGAGPEEPEATTAAAVAPAPDVRA